MTRKDMETTTAIITRGNDFLLRVPVRACGQDGTLTPVDLTQCQDVRLTLVGALGSYALEAQPMEDDSSTLEAAVPGTLLPDGLYHAEATGTLNGARWRSQRLRQLRVTESDDESHPCLSSGGAQDMVRVQAAVTLGSLVVLAPQEGWAAQVEPIGDEAIDALFCSRKTQQQDEEDNDT